jgi:hypothetical protein
VLHLKQDYKGNVLKFFKLFFYYGAGWIFGLLIKIIFVLGLIFPALRAINTKF